MRWELEKLEKDINKSIYSLKEYSNSYNAVTYLLLIKKLEEIKNIIKPKQRR